MGAQASDTVAALACDELLPKFQQQAALAAAPALEKVEGHVDVLGAVIATCCGHKIGIADRNVYAALHCDDSYLRQLTDGDTERLQQLLALCTRCVAWRTTAGATASRITTPQIQAAELFEDALQQPRLNLLGRIFPAAEEVAFVDAARSPQNRCLVAGSEAAVKLCHSDVVDAEMLTTLRLERDLLVARVGGPLDLKPKGFVSKKYAYDGT